MEIIQNIARYYRVSIKSLLSKSSGSIDQKEIKRFSSRSLVTSYVRTDNLSTKCEKVGLNIWNLVDEFGRILMSRKLPSSNELTCPIILDFYKKKKEVNKLIKINKRKVEIIEFAQNIA